MDDQQLIDRVRLAAPQGSAPIDLALIEAARRRRRRVRRVGGAAVAVVLAVAVTAGASSFFGEHQAQVQMITQPPDSSNPQPGDVTEPRQPTEESAPTPHPDESEPPFVDTFDLFERRAITDLDGSFIAFGGDGLARVVDGRVEELWSEPIRQAFPDGRGGVVFQVEDQVSEDTYSRVVQPIRWLPAGADRAVELIPAARELRLHHLWVVGGDAMVLHSRVVDGPDGWMVNELMIRDLPEGADRLVYSKQFGDVGLFEVAGHSRGIIGQLCHTDCVLAELHLDQEYTDLVVVVDGVDHGLGTNGDLIAVLSFDEWDYSTSTPYKTGAGVNLYDADGRLLYRVPLDDGERYDGVPTASLDLARDGHTAIVRLDLDWYDPQRGWTLRGRTYLIRFDGPQPLVQVIDTGQMLRFG